MSAPALDDAARARIAPYVTSLDADVFCLRGLPEEVVAVLFAYYSRSRDGLRENLARLLADQELGLHGGGAGARLQLAESKAREFHEKWVVGYGHASVAEHAVAHVAFENVSIVATKFIEDARLAAYTEKSTRYVVFDHQSFVPLDDALPPAHAKHYRDAASHLLATYTRLMEPVSQRLRAKVPRGEKQPERAYEAAIRAQACDVLRYLLPAGARTNLGMTVNGRTLEQLLVKLHGSTLPEIQRIAAALELEGAQVIPTLLKYTDASAHRTGLAQRVRPVLFELDIDAPRRRATSATVRLVRHDADALDRVVTAIAYEQGAVPYIDFADEMEQLRPDQKERLFAAYVAERGKYDAPLRALEHTSYTFDILLDHGAYRDLQRHRLQTQTAQRLGMDHGYEVPDAAEELGVLKDLRTALDQAGEAWSRIAAHHPEEAQYVVPLAARRRYAMTCNLRELFHLVELRSAKQGHVSYRRVARALHDEITRVHPWAANAIRVDRNEYALARS